MKSRGYWTYERCEEEVSKYYTLSELRNNNNSLYATIIKSNWSDLLIELKRNSNHKPRNFWTYEKCKIEALKFKYKKDLKKEYPVVYRKININKWYELVEHMIPLGDMVKRMIYVYEFSDDNVYVGLTCDIERRNKDHLNLDVKSSVYKHIIKTGLEPKLIHKTDYINVDDAIILEGIILQEYLDGGWLVLNKVKTGGIGRGVFKWYKSNVQLEASKYRTISEFQKNSSGAYEVMRKNNWSGEMCSHMEMIKCIDGYWDNKRLCEEESKKYKNVSKFKQNKYSAYKYSKVNGWLDEFFPNRTIKTPNVYWNDKEKCREESKKYKNNFEFSQNSSTAYKYSLKNAWLDEFYPKNKTNIK